MVILYGAVCKDLKTRPTGRLADVAPTLLALMGLPRWNHPLFTSKRFAKFSDDGFFVCIEARDPKFSQDGTKALLEKAGGKNVELVEDEI
jgi:hypothetical protein